MSSDEGHGLARPIARHLHMQPNLGTTKEQTSPPRSRRERPEPPASDPARPARVAGGLRRHTGAR